MRHGDAPYTREQFQAEAARRMAGFEYTPLVVQPNVEVWHCAKPGSGVYHFTITALLNGMTVSGDISGLLFSVPSFRPKGYGYGIPFLTHQDKEYVASKLEEQCRLKEFDEPAFLRVVAELSAQTIAGLLPPFDLPEGVELPAWVETPHDPSCTFEAVHAWVGAAVNDQRIDAGRRNSLDDLLGELEGAEVIENAHDAYTFLHDSSVFEVDCPGEYSLERLDQELLQRLYMLEHAAQAILAMKDAAEQAVASANKAAA